MITLTRLEPSRHVPGRFLAFLEGADTSLLKVTEEEILRFSLYSGRELDEATLAELTRSAERSNARATAARMIGARPLSKGELVRRLREKGVSAEHAESAARWLEDIGAIDDRAYADMLVRHYAAKGYGPRRIQDELFKRRVPRDFRAEALEQLEDPAETIDRLIERKLRGRTPDRKEYSRVSAFLARRGFLWEDIREGLARYGAEPEEP